jgi:hypothetical protein
MAIKFVLKESLNLLDINANQFNEYLNHAIRPHTIYDMTKSRSKRISVENLDLIIHTLNKIAVSKGFERKFTLEDVMIWVEE